MMLTAAQIARVDKTGFVLSTRMWSLLYSRWNILKMVPRDLPATYLHFKGEDHTKLALVPP